MTLPLALDAAEQEARLGDVQAAKAVVMAEIERIVKEGYAVMTRLESGAFELRFVTSELFQLGDETITRIA